MARPHPVAFGLALVALAASLVANAYLVTRSRVPGRPAAVPGAKTTTTARPSDPGAAAVSCASDLAACRSASANLVSWGIAIGTASAKTDAPSAAPREPAVPSGDPLCDVARDKLREQWQEKKEAIGHEIARMLADPAQQEREARRDAETAADAAGATGSARGDFEDAFVAARLRAFQPLQALAHEDNMDWPGLLDGAHALFAAEDDAVEAHFGADGVMRYRATAESTRLTVLTALATYAGTDWDEATSLP